MSDHQNVSCRYRYDPIDRLATSTSPLQATVQKFYQNERLTTEIQGDVQRSIMQYEKHLLAQQQRHSAGSEIGLLPTDVKRSVLAMLDTGQPHAIGYTPYGHHQPRADAFSLLGFNGERQDPVTGHYLLGNGHRAFNPVLMRFNSPDKSSPFGQGGLNAYAYCLGDPVNRVDPEGTFSFAPLQRAIEYFVGYLFSSRIGSTLLGASSKPIQNFRTLQEGIQVFGDFTKNGSRLNILAHGGIGKRNNTSFSYLVSDRRPVSAEELIGLLKPKINLDKYDTIRLLSCQLADMDLPYAASVSNLTNKPVKAMSGPVFAMAYPPSRNIMDGSIEPSVNLILVGKNHGLNRLLKGYKPKKFFPASNIPVSNIRKNL